VLSSPTFNNDRPWITETMRGVRRFFQAGPMSRTLAGVLAIVLCAGACGQDPQQVDPAQSESRPAGQTVTVHGMVRNGASGEPLPRVLVRINGDASAGALTDGNGRFEIDGVPEGPQDFMVVKPGFIDQIEGATDARNQHGFGHNVTVISQMGDVVFSMVPLNSIEGQVQLSSGDLAEGIQVNLLRRTVQDGRAVWQTQASARTNIDGVYRFGQLPDGLYAVYTEPTMESNAATNLVESGSANKVEREGYACTFYPDARDLAGAAKIQAGGGEQVQANISLLLEPFHPVSARVMMARKNIGAGGNVAVQVTDGQGHSLPYPAQFEAASQTVQAALPDGAYIFRATLQSDFAHLMVTRNGVAANSAPTVPRIARGEVGFAIAGQALSGLQIPISESVGNSIQVILNRNPNGGTQTGDPSIHVMLSQAGGGLEDGIVQSYADGNGFAPLQTQQASPGRYWVHTAIGPKTVCEGSFTAGGASLAREPLVLTSAGTTAPLVLTLRDDCAGLTLSLPGSVGVAAGEEPFYTVYVIPDFDSTDDVVPQTLRVSTGGRIKLEGLTPGSYHVYTFDRPVALEYRNANVLASLTGQAVTLAPGADAELVVEAPRR
jgi:hypothetical protein